MSDTPFSHIDTSYPSLDVLVSDPSNPFVHDETTPGSDPSPVGTQQSNWSASSDIFAPNTLIDGLWPQQSSQSSADLFWNGNQHNLNPLSQTDFYPNDPNLAPQASGTARKPSSHPSYTIH